MSAIAGRLGKNFKHLKKWASKRSLEAYRVYDKDIPDFPYIIDVYGDKVVIWHRLKEIDQDEKKSTHKEELVQALIKIGFSLDKQIHKERFRQKGNTQYEKVEKLGKTSIINEGELKFIVNLNDFLDTGLFLDHRPLRSKLLELGPGMKLLNLFSYTCSLGVAAAKAGAITTNVDLSSKYLEWGEENYKINQIDSSKHKFIDADILEFVKSFNEGFDVIILDPPTFSNSKKMEQNWEVEKDHAWLIRKIARNLNSGGFIIFSNNKRDFKIDTEELKEFNIENLTGTTVPEDFRDKKIHQCYMISKSQGEEESS